MVLFVAGRTLAAWNRRNQVIRAQFLGRKFRTAKCLRRESRKNRRNLTPFRSVWQDLFWRETRTMSQAEPETEQLLDRAVQGDQTALGQLLERHRQRLRHMIALRLDRRLQARLDPSDVLQETLAEAARRLADYVQSRPLPFYPWLRQLAWERLVQLHRRHVRAGKRSVRREQVVLPLSDESALALADRLMSRDSSPSDRLRRNEQSRRVQAILAQLAESDREILVLRYLEHLSTQEIAAVLGLTPAGVKTRQLRALQRLRDLLDDDVGGDML
jgi:RNA polymerase sigma-70 factor (ECF subfamily)